MGRVRFAFLIFSSIGAYGFLLFHLYDIQLRSGDDYLAQAESQNGAAVLTQDKRGAIYFTDKDGARLPAAINKDFPRIYASPKLIADPLGTAQSLAPILGRSTDELEGLFSKNSGYVLLEKKASEETAQKVSDLKIKGVFASKVPERFYPFGNLASQLLGFVGPNSRDNGSSGRYGLEKMYNDILSGEAREEKTAGIASEAGGDIFLTIDSNIQKEAERILENAVEKHNAKGGTIIVEEPKTGKILAMANYPGFDPNSYSESDIAVFGNPTVEQLYEPGSVFKVLTMAAGIDTGKITPTTTFEDTGKLVLYEQTIRNWDLKAHGKVTMTNIIELSLNTGAAYAQRQTGDKAFKSYIEKFGFGEKTGIDLPGEVKGDLRNITPKSAPINFATASFGQGISVTPLQVVNAFSAIANGGQLMRPYVNADMRPQPVRRVISKETAKKVTGMMVSAVDKAEKAKISGYSIAGKTGTAQIPEKGKYSDKVNNTYVGFGPTDDPRFVILVKIVEPEGSPLAGQTSLLPFRDLAQFIINYYNLSPDRL